MTVARRLLLLALLAVFPAQAADRDALWRIVSRQCLPQAAEGRFTPPCLAVEEGAVLLKDRNGVAQLLALPRDQVSGVEAGRNQPGLWAAAWGWRGRMQGLLGRPITRDWMALTVNSSLGRSQDQFHIHLDCLSRASHEGLAGLMGEGVVRLEGHDYHVWPMAEADLVRQDPVILASERLGLASDERTRLTVALAGALGDRLWLLAHLAEPARLDFGHAEEIQDHDCQGP